MILVDEIFYSRCVVPNFQYVGKIRSVGKK